jgi:prefoldin subunit 5
MDSVLEGMEQQLKIYRDNVQALIMSKEEIRAELEKTDSYADDIAHLKTQLERIDKELGVKKE